MKEQICIKIKTILLVLFILLMVNSVSIAEISSTLTVIGIGQDYFYVYDSQDKYITSSKTNREIELNPGEYTIKLNNTKREATVKHEKKTTLNAGSLTVSGTGQDWFYVYDLEGKSLVNNRTSRNIELFPGEYLTKLNNTQERAYVKAGENTNIEAGSLSVSGLGQDWFYVYDLEKKSLANNRTGRDIEFFPGEYLTKLNNSQKRAYVKAGENTNIEAGSLSVSGLGQDWFYVYDLEEKSLANNRTGHDIELFPGEYHIKLNNTKEKSYVQAGEKTSIEAGSLCVTGIGQDWFYVYDLEEKSLANNRTNRDIELFPGEYLAKLNKTQQKAYVEAGKKTSIKAGSLSVSGQNGQDWFYVFDLEGNSLDNSRINTEIELFPGKYIVKLNETSQQANVKAGEKVTIEFGNSKVVLSGCVELKNKPLQKGKAMLMQSGEIFQSVPLDSKGCYRFFQLNEDSSFSVLIRRTVD